MKVLQTIGTLGAKQGGPSTCTYDLMHGLQEIGAPVDLLTIRPRDNDNKILGEGESWLHLVDNDRKTSMAFSTNMKSALDESQYDLYHCNGIWMYPNHITCKVARDKDKPYILSPHGMLYPTALKINRWKKIPLLWWWFNTDIHKSACLHVTCQAELEHCRSFGYKGPIAVIPNPVVFPEGVGLKDVSLELIDSHGRRQIGFLGRLHPIKKVENVLYAMDKLRVEGLEVRDVLSFQIMGKYDEQYEQWLKDEVERLHLEDCVEFAGFVSGKEKYDRLSKLSALMVPSAQENFGMIVPEALVCGTPVYASLGTPWNELNECNAGWWQDNSPETIAKVIRDILSKSDAELRTMGANGLKLMEEEYEQHKVAQMMFDLYKWVLGKCEKPEFVYM